MKIRSLSLALALVAAMAAATVAYAADIVTVPTANQLKQGEVDLAYYYIGLDFPEPMPQRVNVQTLYLGAYAEEKPTIERLHAFITEEGYAPAGKHHEIYLSDPNRTAPERLKTVIRQPVRRI